MMSSRNLRLLHTADWHLGARRAPPLTDSLILDGLYRLAKEQEAEAVLVAGDIFDHHYPRQETKDTLLRFLLDHRDIYWIFSVGNHDYMDKAQSYHSLKYLSMLSEERMQWVFVLEPGQMMYEAALHCAFVATKSWEDLLEPIDGMTKKNPVIAMWHGIVPGLSVKEISEDYTGSAIETQVQKIYKSNPSIKYVALGDIHKRCQLGPNCFYPGALVQKTFSCEDGMVLFEVGGEANQISLGLGKKRTLDVTFTEGEESEQDIVEFVRSNFSSDENARIVFHLPQKIYASLDKRMIHDGTSGFVNSLKLENKPDESGSRAVLSQKMDKAKTLEEELSVALDDQDFDLDKDRLFQTCKRFS